MNIQDQDEYFRGVGIGREWRVTKLNRGDATETAAESTVNQEVTVISPGPPLSSSRDPLSIPDLAGSHSLCLCPLLVGRGERLAWPRPAGTSGQRGAEPSLSGTGPTRHPFESFRPESAQRDEMLDGKNRYRCFLEDWCL